jgi:hypothetical protein
MSDSSDEEITHESHEYPACEEEDCYCRNHWPNRSGGEEHWVIDNYNNGDKTVRCDVAIDNDPNIDVCSCCEYWMVGNGFSIGDELSICIRCKNKLNFVDLFFKVVDSPCKCFLAFPEYQESFVAIDPRLQRTACPDCGLDHLMCPAYEHMARRVFGDKTDIEAKIHAMLLTGDGSVVDDDLTEGFSKEIVKQLDHIREKRRAVSNEKHQRKIELDTRCAAARKRFLSVFVPVLAKLSDKEFDEHVPAKFARLANEADIAVAERLCEAPNEMTSEEVIEFTKTLF